MVSIHNSQEKNMPSEARAALKAAAQKFVTLEKQIASLEAAAGRANAAAIEASAELDNYSDLEQEITRWRVSQVKNGASTKTLPDSLRARAEAKRAAVDELEQSRETLQAVEKELDDTRTKQEAAAEKRRMAAAAVIIESADVLGNELVGLNARRAEILHALFGIQRLRIVIAGKLKPIELGYECQQAMHGGDGLIFPPGSDPIDALAERWVRRFEALLTDPDAEITVPKPVLPSDYIFGAPAAFEPGQGWVGGTPATWKPEAA
jgi:hypothetical protein